MKFDAHVHVFDQDTPLRDVRRYAPSTPAPAEELLTQMHACGVEGALLVQTSFAASPDNLFAVAAARPAQFKVVVAPATHEELVANQDAWIERGAVGIRLNFLGKQLPDLGGRQWQESAEMMADSGLHLELHGEKAEWQPLYPILREWPGDVVIDHLGRVDEPQSMAELAAANDRVWFKVSAPYRWPRREAAIELLRFLREVCPDRLLWGSDWPHTQHEGQVDYASMVAFAQATYDLALLDAFDANLQRLLGVRAFGR